MGDDSLTVRPGAISLLPLATYIVQTEKVVVRGAATLDWGLPICTLRAGATITGYVFGEWFRLSPWPQEGVAATVGTRVTESGEAWVLIDGGPYNLSHRIVP